VGYPDPDEPVVIVLNGSNTVVIDFKSSHCRLSNNFSRFCKTAQTEEIEDFNNNNQLY